MANWFPQEYAAEFYYTKGVLALIGTVLLVWHMSRTWGRVKTWGHRLRYFTLLYFAVLITYASSQQAAEGAPVDYRNMGALVGMVLLIVTAIVSIFEERPRGD